MSIGLAASKPSMTAGASIFTGLATITTAGQAAFLEIEIAPLIPEPFTAAGDI
jgi:hypothetical protein